jgi:CRP/FNR family transcriptional regulator
MRIEEKHTFLKTIMQYIDQAEKPEYLDYFINGTTEKVLKKNEIFITTDKVHHEIGFITNGLAKGYYISEKGDEINTRFIKEGGFITHYQAFVQQTPSNYIFKALEPTQLLCFNYSHVQDCYAKYPSFQRFGRLMAESVIVMLDKRLDSHQLDDAYKRYVDFRRDYPDLHNRLSLTEIASYIRITRPALSRLRSLKM